ncbi:hypothetical protein PYR78_09420 [Acinetobacter johnsonii]|uniref:hypothetical protein n=1 Tax=Acinetobacter johnsonii TaxID=40214 RepID=UPI0024938E58|nr:hypothetical protein [Acinetobacter johnsonii]WEI04992.1 hypothetical protein PYR78_09420 [Acinetobacter johnsonii]
MAKSFKMVLLGVIGLLSSSSLVYADAALSTAEKQLKKDSIRYNAYLPASYTLFEAIQGDLNQDGLKDVVLIVKATYPKQWVTDEYRGKLDRNRRGVIVLLNAKGQYQKVVQNLSLFSSGNEDGGVYFAPELVPSIEKGLLKLHYAHGRYGYWAYQFRLEGHDMRLIGYDSSDNFGPYVNSETSVNFLTAKKLVRENLNKDPDSDPKFKETWSKVNVAPMYLSTIHDIDDLSLE